MKKSKINKLLLFFGLLILFSCSKDNELTPSNKLSQENFVGLSQAKEIAEVIKFTPKDNNSQVGKNTSLITSKKKIESIDEVKTEDGNTVFYVVNYIGGGYIILSADNRIQPIISFSEDSKFTLDDGKDQSYPLGLKSWVQNAKKQIYTIQKSSIKQTKREKVAWKEVKNIMVNMDTFENQSLTGKKDEPNPGCTERVVSQTKGPFLKTQWWQFDGFNDALGYMSCNSNTQHIFAGCVPIAMAQVMRFYQYPANYDWVAMPMNNATPVTANFILNIHNAINSVFPGEPSSNCYGTGVTTSKDMSVVLKTKFNYTSAQKANYDPQIVKAELNAGRPVILEGFDKNTLAGHMWVCDGYSALQYYFDDCTGASAFYFNMNWGWKEGKNNGYYAYDNFTTTAGSFNEALKMTYNIIP